ncbi:MAG: nitrile hydratase subunit beta [Gammaproteobacteria bacterium]|nr:nitrile hydratase subunit beta [Gammaproteobacteria bacterium]
MDGVHDLGGKQGHGSIDNAVDETAFHERWEAIVFALTNVAAELGVLRNTDQFRHAIERIDPVAYLSHTYYGRWLGGLENLLVEGGILTQAQIRARIEVLGYDSTGLVAARPSTEPDVVDYDAEHHVSSRPLEDQPKFRVGDGVLTRGTPSTGHTRLPAYARGKRGEVVMWHDGWVLPDSNAHGRGENPEHLYTVAFDGGELWGDAAEPRTVVHVDLFESYLIL